MTDKNTVKIVFSGSNEAAPLFCQYQGQHRPQPAYVTLDLRSGEVDADYDGNIGGTSTDVWNNRILRWSVNSQLSGNQVQDLLVDLLPTLQIIFDGADVEWDGSNMVGKLITDEAIAAFEKLDRDSEHGLLHDAECNLITDLKDWLANSGRDCWIPGPDADVEQYIADFSLDGYTAVDDLRETIMDMWADELYSGKPLQRNVAQYLLSTGHCNNSVWTEELAAYAEGRQPE